MNYFEQHIGDYAKDAGHLSMIEDGAYRRLLDAYYTRERALPSSTADCCKLARATTKAEKEAVSYVLREFFELCADGYHQKRADEEIARFKDKQSKAKRSANARWSHERMDTDGNANGMRTHSERDADGMHRAPVPSNQTPVTNQEQEKSKSAAGAAVVPIPADPKAALWARWKELPDGGGGAFLSKLIRDSKDEQAVLEAVERTLDHAPADPKAFIVGVLRKPEVTPQFGTGQVL